MGRDLHDGHIHPRGHFCGSNCPKHKLGPEVGEAAAAAADRIPATSGPSAATAPLLDRVKLYRGVKATWPIPHGAEREVTEAWVALCDVAEAARDYVAALDTEGIADDDTLREALGRLV